MITGTDSRPIYRSVSGIWTQPVSTSEKRVCKMYRNTGKTYIYIYTHTYIYTQVYTDTHRVYVSYDTLMLPHGSRDGWQWVANP